MGNFKLVPQNKRSWNLNEIETIATRKFQGFAFLQLLKNPLT